MLGVLEGFATIAAVVALGWILAHFGTVAEIAAGGETLPQKTTYF